jgi:hypothetical protein
MEILIMEMLVLRIPLRESRCLLFTWGAVDLLYPAVIASRPRSTAINTRTRIFTIENPH